MDDEPLTTVWEVREEEVYGYGAGDFVVTTELFETQEAVKASCPTDGQITAKVVRRAPLATQVRWRGCVMIERAPSGWETARVGKPGRYVVTEQSPEFGKPPTVGRSYGDVSCHGPDQREVLTHLHEVADPINEAWAKHMQRDAEENQDYRCPDHGHLGRTRIGAALPCKPCRRWVDKDGNRFGHYGTTVDGQHSYSLTPSNGYDEGPL